MNKIAGGKPSCLAAGVAPDRPLPSPDRAPPSFKLILPIPPSVNSYRRNRLGRPLGNRSANVVTWCHEADAAIWQLDEAPRTIGGDFEIEIVWDKKKYGRSDIDNRIKPLLDYLQSRELIENDRLCWRLVAGWGAPKGQCIVTVRRVFL